MKKIILIFSAIFSAVCSFAQGNTPQISRSEWLQRSNMLLDSVVKHYRTDNVPLLRENIDPDADFKADYLATSQSERSHAFLWPYSGALSAAAAQYEAKPSRKKLKEIRNFISQGLDQYLDSARTPAAYASYTPSSPAPDRFYDDNIWLGIDFVDLYSASGEKDFLHRAEGIWKFLLSGRDTVQGDGIYWCEQRKDSKNTCSNAPAAVFALKLYRATHNDNYLRAGKELYAWTRKHLYDTEEQLYSDNVKLDGRIDRAKYSYNSGQMLQSAVMLYAITHEKHYMCEADTLAEACAKRFFVSHDNNGASRVKMHDVWFDAVLMRGFLEHYSLTGNPRYLNVYRHTLNNMWTMCRNKAGLLNFSETSGRDRAYWLLAECATAEMMARIARIKL